MIRGPVEVLTVFGGVADGVIHIGNAALVHKIHDELHLVQTLEICHLRRVTGFDQNVVTAFDQLYQAPAQHHLLAEQVGLAFLTEAGLDDPGPATADRAAIGKCCLKGAT